MITVLQFLLSLSILVVLHEFGHYFPSRWFKIRVDKFYLFFDPYFSLVSKKIGETEWGIGWLPLGGYCKIAGMVDESFDSEQMKGEPQPWEFRSKPAWQRLIVMLGGVIVNFILGLFIFSMMIFVWGKSYIENDSVTEGIYVDSVGMQLGLQDGDQIYKVGDKIIEKFGAKEIITGIVFDDAQSITVKREGQQVELPVSDTVTQLLTSYDNQKAKIISPRILSVLDTVGPGTIAEEIGLTKGDQLVSINGDAVQYYHDYKRVFSENIGNESHLKYLRNGEEKTATYTAQEKEMLGILPVMPNIIVEEYGLGQSIKLGSLQGIDFLRGQINAFRKMFTGEIKVEDSLGSFITIGKQYGPTWDWFRFWNMTAMLSLILAFLNLLPIPALDGGHVMFLLYEVVAGKKPSDRFLEIATLAGFILLVVFMIYAIKLDITRHYF